MRISDREHVASFSGRVPFEDVVAVHGVRIAYRGQKKLPRHTRNSFENLRTASLNSGTALVRHEAVIAMKVGPSE
jgi:hypothetical protein